MPRWMKWTIALLIGFALIVFGWRMSDSRWLGWVLPTFFVINCFVLIVVVLLQSGKAADLAGAFGGAGSQTAFGPRGAANAMSTATTWCAIMFMLCAMALVLRTDKTAIRNGSILQNYSKPAPKPAPVTTPATTPVHPSSIPGSTPPSTSGTAPVPPQSNSQPASQAPAASQPAPAASQPAPVQPKKP